MRLTWVSLRITLVNKPRISQSPLVWAWLRTNELLGSPKTKRWLLKPTSRVSEPASEKAKVCPASPASIAVRLYGSFGAKAPKVSRDGPDGRNFLCFSSSRQQSSAVKSTGASCVPSSCLRRTRSHQDVPTLSYRSHVSILVATAHVHVETASRLAVRRDKRIFSCFCSFSN